MILDIDLHHGNGTQDIAWRINQEANRAAKSSLKPATPHRDLQIFYGSLHDIYSYRMLYSGCPARAPLTFSIHSLRGWRRSYDSGRLP